MEYWEFYIIYGQKVETPLMSQHAHEFYSTMTSTAKKNAYHILTFAPVTSLNDSVSPTHIFEHLKLCLRIGTRPSFPSYHHVLHTNLPYWFTVLHNWFNIPVFVWFWILSKYTISNSEQFQRTERPWLFKTFLKAKNSTSNLESLHDSKMIIIWL